MVKCSHKNGSDSNRGCTFLGSLVRLAARRIVYHCCCADETKVIYYFGCTCFGSLGNTELNYICNCTVKVS